MLYVVYKTTAACSSMSCVWVLTVGAEGLCNLIMLWMRITCGCVWWNGGYGWMGLNVDVDWLWVCRCFFLSEWTIVQCLVQFVTGDIYIYISILSQLHPSNGLFEQEKLTVLHFVHLLGKYFISPSTQMESLLDPSNALFECGNWFCCIFAHLLGPPLSQSI